MEKEVTLSKLLEELIRETSKEPSSAEELAERLRNTRRTLAKLLDAAPLLALAAGWDKGDCRILVSYAPLPKYEDDYRCLQELVEYLNANNQIIAKELEELGCRVYTSTPLLFKNRAVLKTTASLLSSIKHYISIILSSETSTQEKQIAMRELASKYSELLLALRMASCVFK